MDPLVIAAFITGIVGIVTGLLTLRATRETEETKQRQADNAAEIDTVQLRLDHWSELVEAQANELARKDKALEIERGRNEALRETIEVLRERLEKGAP